VPSALRRSSGEGAARNHGESAGYGVESLYARGGIDFRTRVFDLGMMQYRLVGGRIHRFAGRPSALFAYRGPEGRDLVCQMYEGGSRSAPKRDRSEEGRDVRARA